MLLNSTMQGSVTSNQPQFAVLQPPVGGQLKRLADIAIAVASLVVLSPIIVMIAALIKLTSPGPVLFYQYRVGYKGREFRCYKFRTMVVDADRVLAELLTRDSVSAAEWAKTQKLMDDPRATTIGLLLRKSSLDEIPQLFNVLAGDMSCVGPRPVLPSEMARYGRYAREYLKARPGITGLWQVSGRSTTTYERRIALDRYYVRRWSLLLDFKILLRTVVALLSPHQTS